MLPQGSRGRDVAREASEKAQQPLAPPLHRDRHAGDLGAQEVAAFGASSDVGVVSSIRRSWISI